MNLKLNANTTQRSQKMVSSRFWILAFSAIFLSLATLPAVANPFDDDDDFFEDDDDDIDDDEVVSGEYTCNPILDYGAPTCKTIQNGICDNPNHGGGGGKDCFEQDCIDCNYFCKWSRMNRANS